MGSPIETIEDSSKKLVQLIKAGNREALEEVFYRYYHELCSLASRITKCPDQARDVVQDVFFKLWKKRHSWEIKSSLQAYLYQAVWNQALNSKSKKESQRKLRHAFSEETANGSARFSSNQSDNKTSHLIAEIWKIVNSMAERRKYVFILHRKHGLTYKEIADVMNVTRKTVENHMGLALKEIRDSLDEDLLS